VETVTLTFAWLCKIVESDWPGIRVRLYLDSDQKSFKKFRQVAYAVRDRSGLRVAVSPRLESMPKSVITGVMAHELGHIVDFAVAQEGLKQSYGRLPETPERRADAIAERLFGLKISYDKYDLETTGPGTRPRPKHLGL